MAGFGAYSGRTTGQALESLRECLHVNGPPENLLGALREDLALTQSHLASMSGVSQGFISEVEAGKKRLSRKSADRLAKVLGVEAGPLLAAVRMGSLKTLIEDGRGPLAGEIIAVLALISENLPDGRLKNLLMATLVDALQDAAERDRARLKELSGKEGAQAAALKSRKSSKGLTPSRDHWGRKVKPERLVALKAKEAIVRDSFGRSRPKKDGIERDSFGRNRSKTDGRTG
jgi:transcriptional regulator with XRE-family HTH domain